MLVLSTRIVLDCFYLLIFYSEKFSTDVCRLPYAVNVNLNLSNDHATRRLYLLYLGRALHNIDLNQIVSFSKIT